MTLNESQFGKLSRISEGRGYTFHPSPAMTGNGNDHQVIVRHPDHDNGDWTGNRVGVIQWDGSNGAVAWASTHPDHPRATPGMLSAAVEYSQRSGIKPPSSAPATTPAGNRMLRKFNPEAARQAKPLSEKPYDLSDGWEH